MEMQGFFSSTRRKKWSTRIEVSVDSSSDDLGRRVVLVDLISSVTTPATTPAIASSAHAKCHTTVFI
jgi:hypothetical protein